MGGRPGLRFPGSEATYLPFSEAFSKEIISEFQIHRSIARVVNRNTTATFQALRAKDSHTNGAMLVFNCRSSAEWANDLALSVSYSPSTRDTHAVLYGCYEDARKKFVSRLSTCDFETCHPLTLPTIFAEVERDRHFKILEPLCQEGLARVRRPVSAIMTDDEKASLQSPSESSDDKFETDLSSENHMGLWLRISWFRTGLMSWKRELEKMIACVDDLNQDQFHLCPRSSRRNSNSSPVSNKQPFVGLNDKGLPTLRRPVRAGSESTLVSEESVVDFPDKDLPASNCLDELALLEYYGKRIKQRLLELRDEYDEKIGKCTTVMDGMILVNQLEWNYMAREDAKTNLAIAEAAVQDGRRMRLIAVLTMIFLPATFVATVFSMTFFNWSPEQGELVSPYVWVYVLGTGIFSGLVWIMWSFYSQREKKLAEMKNGENMKV